MNAMSATMRGPPRPHDLSSRIGPRALDRTAISRGVLSRRARIREIEAEIDSRCESAAVGCLDRTGAQAREDWDERTWRRYVAEAIQQARLCSTELNVLRQEASHLERLIRMTGME